MVTNARSFFLLVLITVFLWPLTATAEPIEGCDGAPTSIAVKVRGVRSDHVTVNFELYSDDPDEFLVRG